MKAFSFEKEETVTDRGMLEWNVRIHTKDIFQIWFIFLFCFWMVIIPIFCLSFNIDEVHCMAESVWKAEHHTHNFRSMGINLSQLLSSFYSTSMLEQNCRDLLPFRHKSISEARHWFWARSRRPRSLNVQVWASCRSVKFFRTRPTKPFLFHGPGFVHIRCC